MAKVKVVNQITLDGVMQAPASPTEDTRGGFEHGGWALPYQDEVMAKKMAGDSLGSGGNLLLGRFTYEEFAASWPHMPDDNPFTAVMNSYKKYVASTTLTGPLEWNNSELLDGDAREVVPRLKDEVDADLVILGSGNLVQSLLGAGLVDELLLTIHPLVLGTGIRLFPDGGAFAKLDLVESIPTTTGAIIATYVPA